ncbi:hypothetical protein [Brevibacillus sp. SIMBA_040]|uniref:hypothetical protein n=1 Tax=unclassified Brevibacillus TaxID=2684853 RepID=UPI00397DB51E
MTSPSRFGILSNKANTRNVTVMPQVIEKLASLPWLGNVRELKNTIDYMLAVCYVRDAPYAQKSVP